MITYVLAVWRLAHMVVKEDGPGDILPTVRDWTVQTEWVPEWVAKAFQCVSCASIWIAGFLLLVDRTPLRWVRWVLAGSAVAKLLEDYFYAPPADDSVVNGDFISPSDISPFVPSEYWMAGRE